MISSHDGKTRWFLGLGLTAALLQLFSTLRYYSGQSLRAGMHDDNFIFQHAGWYLTKGGRLYVDIWEPKPPLAFETTALFALLSFGDPMLQRVIEMTATFLVIPAISILTAALTLKLTEDLRASVLAGLVPFVLPAYHLAAARGFKDKYFAVFFGLLAIYLILNDREIASGAAAAAATGYYQIAIIYPLLVVGIAWNQGRYEPILRTIGGGVGITAVILAPVVAWGAVNQMIAQTIFLPVIIEGSVAQPTHLIMFEIVRDLGYGAIVAMMGIFGLRYVPSNYEKAWWVVAGVVWGVGTLLPVEYDGTNDLFVLLGFLALGVGLLLATVSLHRRRIVAVTVAMAVVISVIFPGGFGILIGSDNSILADVGDDLEASVENDDEPVLNYEQANQYADTLRQPSELYWERIKPLDCWYPIHNSGDLRAWVAFVAGSNGFSYAKRRPSRVSADSRKRVCHDYDLEKLTRMAFL